MTETEFWGELARRFNSLDETASRALGGWCDGFEARRYVTTGPSPHVQGRVDFVDGRRLRRWKFRLHLAGEHASFLEIDWRAQLPSNDPDWYSVDALEERVEIIGGSA